MNKSLALVPQDKPSENSDTHPQNLDSAKLASFLYLILKNRMKCYKPKGKLENCCERNQFSL